MKEFNNRENECIVQDGKEYWISRSVALVAQVYAKVGEELYVLTEKRSLKMDQPGKQCLVCGYIDWDENGWQGIEREIYEETTLDLDDIKQDLIFDNDQQPYFVKTDPGENRQNITLNYVMVYDFGRDGHYAMLQSEKFSSDEVDEVKWVPVSEIDKYTWAFDHDKRMKDGLRFLIKKGIQFASPEKFNEIREAVEA